MLEHDDQWMRFNGRMIFDSRLQEEQKLSYDQAKERCREINERATLITLRSQVENDDLNTELTRLYDSDNSGLQGKKSRF